MTDLDKRVIRKYYGFQIGITFLLWVPIFYSYQKQMGVSDQQFFNIQSLYYLIFCLLDLPTGFIADRHGYKKTLTWAGFVMLATNLSAVVWTTASGFLFHFALVALARSLADGAASAFIYDYLRSIGQTENYKQVEGKARSYSLIFRIFGWSLSGYLMRWQISSPYWLTAIACAFAWYFAFQLPTLKNQQPDNAEKPLSLWQEIKESLAPIPGILRANPRLMTLMFIGVGITVLVRLSQVNLYQPIMQGKGFDLTSLGWAMSVMTFFEAAGAHNTFRLRKYFTDLTIVQCATVLLSLSLIAITFSGKFLTLTCFVLLTLFAGLAYPALQQLLNDAIPDNKYRATLLSSVSIIDRAFCVLAAWAAGIFVPKGQMNGFLMTSALLAILLVSLVVRRLKRLT